MHMELEEHANKIAEIHDKLSHMTGSHFKVRANMGRSRVVERDGVLLQTHDSLFIVEVEERRGRRARQSYQYVDVLTGMVELSHDGESLFEPLMLELNGKPADEAELVDQEA